MRTLQTLSIVLCAYIKSILGYVPALFNEEKMISTCILFQGFLIIHYSLGILVNQWGSMQFRVYCQVFVQEVV